MRQAWVISVGTELTLGQTVDANGAWLAAKLAEVGIRTQRHVTVPDDVDATRDVLLQAAESCDVILVTGGLGPTADDLTRHALAAAAGVGLELHAPTLERLRAFFASRRREMPPANRVQALVPQTGCAIPNTCGTAPGLRIELRGVPCYALPGVPSEMQSMFERDVAPELRTAARGDVLLSRRLHTFGLAEADLGERIGDLMTRGRNPEVGTTAQFGIISIRLNATASAPADAAARLDETETEIRRRLGDVIFGRDDDTLAAAVGGLLSAGNRTVSTAESCTGGMIGALLTDVAGSSQYYLGGAVTYANEAKAKLLGVVGAEIERHGAVSERVARAMADGAARVFGTDYAISVTGVAGPTGGTPDKPVGLVFIAVHTPTATTAHECRFGGNAGRHAVRLRASHTALNLLRLDLLREGLGGQARPG